MTRSVWSSKRWARLGGRFSLLAVCLLAAVACGEESPTEIASQAAQAPGISELAAKSQSGGVISLQVKALDPSGSALSYKWTVDEGTLSASNGSAVLWRPPQTAGFYNATVEVTNAKGFKRSAVQRIQVAGDGKVDVTQPATIAAPSTTAASNGGGFSLPSPVPSAVPSLLVVGANPDAPGQPASPPASPFTQPVATSAPGPTGPASPVPQPIATATLTPPPPSPSPSPTPTPRPPRPEPGVPEPPMSSWVRVPPAGIPIKSNFSSLSFVPGNDNRFMEGWAVGTASTVLHTTDGGVTWAQQGSGLPSEMIIKRVSFVSPQRGFIGANAGRVYRTIDGGATWQDVSPPFSQIGGTEVTGLVAYSDNIVVLGTADGRALRSANAGLASAGSVSWSSFTTKPPDRPADNAQSLFAANAFISAADTTMTWFVGDGVFRLDSDNPTPAQVWRKPLGLGGSAVGNGSAIALPSSNDIWVGTELGRLFHSVDTGNSWNAITEWRNREHNGFNFTLRVDAISAISFVDSNNGWVAADGGKVLETDNAGQTWRQSLVGTVLNDLQIESRMVTDANGTHREFFGWGVGNSGAIFRYLPN